MPAPPPSYPDPSSIASPRHLVRRGLVTVFIAYFTSYLILSSLNVALPRIAAELDGLQLYSWALAVPALATAIATLVFGKLSDMYGRRLLLLAALGFYLGGAGLCATSTTFGALIFALSILSLGQGAIAPLCFSVLGDLFAPVERSKWAGLLNIASGIAALFGPTLGGWLVDNLSWRWIFWLLVPLILLSAAAVLVGLPSVANKPSQRIDSLGTLLLAAAASTTLLVVSWGGTTYAWASAEVLSLVLICTTCWILFFVAEARAAEAILDPQVFRSRVFITVSLSALMSFFGLTAIMAYYPLFLQGVQRASATLSGQIITPFSVLMSFTGVPAGLLLARTQRYKWMYIVGYGVLTISLFGLATFTSRTPVVWGFVVSSAAGIGLGAIPTLNTLVVQYAVPKRLLGAATGGIFFFVMLGRAISPAILGSAMNSSYSGFLASTLPASLAQQLDGATMGSLGNPRVLLSVPAMAELERSLDGMGDQGQALLSRVVEALRASMESGLRIVFLIGAVTMLVAFVLVLTIPEIALEAWVPERKPPAPAIR